MVLEMLGKILVEKQMISDIKENPNFAFHTMLPEHKARSLSLLETILRNMSALDAVINTYLNQKTSIRVINILRIASAEILIDKIAVHAAVDSAVRLAKLDTKLSRFSGLINAVCRKISKRLTDGSNLDEPRLLAARELCFLNEGEFAGEPSCPVVVWEPPTSTPPPFDGDGDIIGC